MPVSCCAIASLEAPIDWRRDAAPSRKTDSPHVGSRTCAVGSLTAQRASQSAIVGGVKNAPRAFRPFGIATIFGSRATDGRYRRRRSEPNTCSHRWLSDGPWPTRRRIDSVCGQHEPQARERAAIYRAGGTPNKKSSMRRARAWVKDIVGCSITRMLALLLNAILASKAGAVGSASCASSRA